MAQKRIRKQLEQISKDPPVNCLIVGPKDSSNLYQWQIGLYGPEGTPYQTGLFFLNVSFPREYPFKPPKCNFKTKIYHPNINDRGSISMGHCLCCGCGSNWSPALTIEHIIKEVMQILKEPNSKDPLVPEIAKQYDKNRTLFRQIAREWTKKIAQ